MASEARRSPLDGNFAFLDAKLEEWPKAETSKQPLRTLNAGSGIYDPDRGDLVLRGLRDAYIDLVGGKVTFVE